MVDDEPPLLKLIKRMLEARGTYAVRGISDPKEATKVASQFKPDVILMDLMMPDADGSEVALRIRALPEMRDIPIIFFTSLIAPDEAAVTKGKIHNDLFVSKTSDVDVLVAGIQKVLNCRSRLEPAGVAGGLSAW